MGSKTQLLALLVASAAADTTADDEFTYNIGIPLWALVLLIAFAIFSAIFIFVYFPIRQKLAPAFGVYRKSRVLLIIYVLEPIRSSRLELVRYTRKRYIAAEIRYDRRLRHTRLLMREHKPQSEYSWEDWAQEKRNKNKWFEAVFPGRPEELITETTPSRPSYCTERKRPPTGGVYDLSWHDSCIVECYLVKHPLRILTYKRLRPDHTVLDKGKRKFKQVVACMLGAVVGFFLPLGLIVLVGVLALWLLWAELAGFICVTSAIALATALPMGWLRSRWATWERENPRTDREKGYIEWYIEPLGPKTRRVAGYRVRVRAGHLDTESEEIKKIIPPLVPATIHQEIESLKAKKEAVPPRLTSKQLNQLEQLTELSEGIRHGIRDVELALVQLEAEAAERQEAKALEAAAGEKLAQARKDLQNLKADYDGCRNLKMLEETQEGLGKLKKLLEEVASAVRGKPNDAEKLDPSLIPKGLDWVTRTVGLDQLSRLVWMHQRRYCTLDPHISVTDMEGHLLTIERSLAAIAAEVNDPQFLADIVRRNIDSRLAVMQLEERVRAQGMSVGAIGAEYVSKLVEITEHLERKIMNALNQESDQFGGEVSKEQELIEVVSEMRGKVNEMGQAISLLAQTQPPQPVPAPVPP